MYVKASGARLRDVSARRGWRRLELERLRDILRDERMARLPDGEREAAVAAQLISCCVSGGEQSARPSVESHMHALLGRCTAHLHPLAVLACVCARNGRDTIEEIFGDDRLPPLWVPYTNPGHSTARRLAGLIARYIRRYGEKPSVLFMDRHGLLTTAEDADDLVQRTYSVVRRIRRHLPRAAAAKPAHGRAHSVSEARLALRGVLFSATGHRVVVKHVASPEVGSFLARRDARDLVAIPALTPDEIVYAGGPPLWAETVRDTSIQRALRRRSGRGEVASAAVIMPGLGLFAAGSASAVDVVAETACTSLAVRSRATAFGGPRPLSARHRQFIETWEAESYRAKLAAGPGAGELNGRVAVVTGAGSGLGRSIAMGLAQAGAAVACADIDAGGARDTASEICAGDGHPSIGLGCDVTSEKSVAAAYDRVLDAWGGLDILVNAAGIAPSHDLVDFPLDEWRRALDVNLTGYFLMARAAARIMVQQGMGGSIVNLSSKSGLEASKSNSPYNATKAGEIHLARGWALELGEHGIRVNSVAPGNVFEGSQIWSPDYIRQCARKHGIRPAEVIPYYVGKTALKRKITGEDVANAVVYLCSEKARTITGQTLVPDSGQVMVR
jgi:NAD(P)-dependent dehydrogenase (short-subunit alcohol dehydrogenase family)/rhamnose utilization protein RhaD (predicted bifunctional aldolase and dehydrogenase)